MQKAQNLQKKMGEIQQEINLLEITGTSGGGLVKMTMTGDYQIKSIDIDDSLISIDEKTVLIDLIIASYNDTKRKVADISEEKMKEVTDGLPIPPGMKIPGMF